MAKILCEWIVSLAAVFGLYCAFYWFFLRLALEKKRGLRLVVDREPNERLCVRLYVAKKLLASGLLDGIELTIDEADGEREREREESNSEPIA